MKTIEEKAKAYDEALERAQKATRAGSDAAMDIVQYIFPELRESEDERIRKKLIGIFTNQSLCDVYNLKSEDVLAYLEKQKEPKPISAVEVLARAGLKPYKDGNQWCILVGDNIQEGICGFGDTIDEALYQFLMEVLEMQKEQKPVEWSESDTLMCNAALELLRSHPNLMASHGINKSSVIRWLKSLSEKIK